MEQCEDLETKGCERKIIYECGFSSQPKSEIKYLAEQITRPS